MSKPSVQKLSFVEKAGYSLGDGAANFVFQTMILFQLNFYTDTMGIVAAVAGSLLLVGRLWDAFFDPMMGLMADRTNTRWGKFRPWVLWTALPWGAVMVVAYTTPNLSAAGKIVYACVTNVMLMTLYSANNTPYSAMTGVMTGDVNERTSLSSYRFVAAMVAQLIVGGFTLPLVAKFGHGDNAKGWQMTMGLWASICVVLFVITFLTTRERIQPDPKQKSDARKDFSTLLATGPWVAMFILTLAHFAVLAMRGGTLSYYFQYYVNHDRLFDLLTTVGLANPSGHGAWSYFLNTFGLVVDPKHTNVASVGFSFFNMSSQFVTVIGVLCSTFLSMKFGKKAVAIVGFSLTTIFMAMFAFIPPDSVGSIFLLEYVRALTYAPTIPLIWSMYADVVDYSEWKTGRRITGVIYATIIFGLKFGLSLGGAMAGWLLSGFGYRANAVQTPESLNGIRLTISLFPTVLFVVVIVCLVCYKIGRQLNLQIQDELAERRKGFAPAG
ncbi:MAG TPA: MFS transporter [Bryobacteraceae bacterium]|jgi:Na+/melibiose symporter-like transporter|nr:MFS transporter [Bryobacteraceae bacterium]